MALALGANSNDGYLDYGDLAALNGATSLSLLFWSWGGGAVSHFAFAKGTLLLAGMSGENVMIRDTAAGWHLQTHDNVVPTNVWTHWGIVYDGTAAVTSRMAFYRNAESRPLFGLDSAKPQGTDAASTAPTALPNYSNAFQLSNANLSGVVGHVRMYTAPLSAGDVAQEMHRYWASRRADLLIDSPYDDQIVARDYSTNGHHPTVVLGSHGPVQSQSPVGYGGKMLVTG